MQNNCNCICKEELYTDQKLANYWTESVEMENSSTIKTIVVDLKENTLQYYLDFDDDEEFDPILLEPVEYKPEKWGGNNGLNIEAVYNALKTYAPKHIPIIVK